MTPVSWGTGDAVIPIMQAHLGHLHGNRVIGGVRTTSTGVPVMRNASARVDLDRELGSTDAMAFTLAQHVARYALTAFVLVGASALFATQIAGILR